MATLYCIIKYSRATSRVNWLSGEKKKFQRTISVLVFRVLILATLDFSPFNQLTQLVAREYFIMEYFQSLNRKESWNSCRHGPKISARGREKNNVEGGEESYSKDNTAL
jgi:hypothetical protein